ncbi:hypothetical protein C3L33_16261, partial [Rhododendron williamsianum]
MQDFIGSVRVRRSLVFKPVHSTAGLTSTTGHYASCAGDPSARRSSTRIASFSACCSSKQEAEITGAADRSNDPYASSFLRSFWDPHLILRCIDLSQEQDSWSNIEYNYGVFVLLRICKILRLSFSLGDGEREVLVPSIAFPLVVGWSKVLSDHSRSNFNKATREDDSRILDSLQDDDITWQPYIRPQALPLEKTVASNIEVAAGHATVVDFDAAKDGELGILTGRSTKKKFSFDRVYTPKDDQVDVFANASPMVISVLDGYSVCIFAYEQTGTGKTYTAE